MARLTAGSLIGGRYRLERRVGHGGMSVVWLARDEQLDAPVAVKLMGESLLQSKTLRTRFEREARAAAQLRSPHIVAIQELGTEGDTPFMVMELLEGEDLHGHLKREGRLAVAAAHAILIQIARGLGHAHRAGMVHRDLKPSNVFLCANDDQLLVKIVDFGLAKVAHGEGATLTETGQLLGTPHFMSPEQALGGRDVDSRSDVWSLGAIAFRMLTGEPLVDVDEPAVALLRIVEGKRRRASDLVPDLPPGTDEFFDQALARRPDERFQTAQALVDGCSAWLPPAVSADSVVIAHADTHPSHERDGLDPLDRTVPAAPALDIPETVSGATVVADAHGSLAPSPASGPGWRGIALAALGLLAVGGVSAFVLVPRGAERQGDGAAALPVVPAVSLEPAAGLPTSKDDAAPEGALAAADASAEASAEPASTSSASGAAAASVAPSTRPRTSAPRVRASGEPKATAPEVPDFGY
jgi:serine/threonine-protein kinase